jgi:KRAB domain-containing zinc finger protein
MLDLSDDVTFKYEPTAGSAKDQMHVADDDDDENDDDTTINQDDDDGGGDDDEDDLDYEVAADLPDRRKSQAKRNVPVKKLFKDKANIYCPYCQRALEQDTPYLTHMQLHASSFGIAEDGESGSYTCKHCAKKLANFRVLCNHVRLLAGEEECSVCKVPVISGCELREHKREHKMEKMKSRYCKVCDKMFSEEMSVAEFLQHVRNHKAERRKRMRREGTDYGSSDDENEEDSNGEVKNYICPYCKEIYQNGIHLKKHKHQFAVEDHNGKFRCRYCNVGVQRFCALYRHIRLGLGENECSECNEEVMSMCELSKHRKKHRQEQARYCGWCEKLMLDLNTRQFTQHLLQHRGEEKKDDRGRGVDPGFVCSACGKMYHDGTSLKEHWKRVHSDEQPFVCGHQGCEKKFKTKRDLRQHLAVHEDKKEVCEICGIKFRRPKELRSHMQSHFGKKHQCDQCSRRFTDNYSLKKHVESVHMGIKPYSCKLCAKKFTCAGSLSKHMRCIHTDARPYCCNECTAAFKCKDALEKHLLRHANVKPYKCVDCGMCFRESSSFTSHRKAKHRDSVYICKLCGASFHIPQSLSFHMKMCHNEVAFDEEKFMPTSAQQLVDDSMAAATLSQELENTAAVMFLTQ